MDSMNGWGGGRLIELTGPECDELLVRTEVGRLIWTGAEGPEVVPVNFVWHGGSLWLRTAPYSRVAGHVDGELVAFEIDDVQPFDRAGWSVIVKGTARRCSPDQMPPDGPLIEPWPNGAHPLVVMIAPREVTGRRLLPT